MSAAIRPLLSASLGALLLSAVSSAAAQNVSYSQGTFKASDWQQVVTRQTNGWTGSTALLTSDGNPGSNWLMKSSRLAPAVTGDIHIANINTLFTYNPGTNGAIAALDFSFDLLGRSSVGYSAPFFGFFSPVIRQNGELYRVSRSVVEPTSVWATSTFSFTPASSWLSPILGNTSLPDFTSGGGTIEFGYFFAAGGTCPTNNCSEAITMASLDNYSVSITAVPEPSTYALMAAGLAGLLVVRRRRSTNRSV